MTGFNDTRHESPMPAQRAAGFGKYFGVCASFHHSKACLCPGCSRRPSHGIVMYCAKGSCETYGSYSACSGPGVIGSVSVEKTDEENAACLCASCAVYKQFTMRGTDFCTPETTPAGSETGARTV